MAKIKASLGKGPDAPSVTIDYELGDSKDGKASLPGLVKQFGEDVIAAHARSSIVVAAQGAMRLKMKPGEDGKPVPAAQVQKQMAEWKPGLRTPGKTVVEKTKDLASKMTAEEKAELLKILRS